MRIVYYDFKNQLTWSEITDHIKRRTKELKLQGFSEEEVFQIVFGSEKFKTAFLEEKFYLKAKKYFLKINQKAK